MFLVIAMLRAIIGQHKLTLSDFKAEIGAKSTVSIILSGSVLSHCRASRRSQFASEYLHLCLLVRDLG